MLRDAYPGAGERDYFRERGRRVRQGSTQDALTTAVGRIRRSHDASARTSSTIMRSEAFQAISLPYGDRNVAMTRAAEARRMRRLSPSLTAERTSGRGGSARARGCWLPSFKAKYETALKIRSPRWHGWHPPGAIPRHVRHRRNRAQITEAIHKRSRVNEEGTVPPAHRHLGGTTACRSIRLRMWSTVPSPRHPRRAYRRAVHGMINDPDMRGRSMIKWYEWCVLRRHGMK